MKRKQTYAICLFCAACVWPAGIKAHDNLVVSLQQIWDAGGWDITKMKIRTEQVADNFYVLFGAGGNIGVSVGEQGVLIVDDQFPEMFPKVNEAIREVGGGAIDFAINSHWHYDHADGNKTLGPSGTWLVSHSHSREKMMSDNVIDMVVMKYLQKAYPKDALPIITYDDSMQFHFNGERVDLMHFGPAHTAGDTAVIFRGSNVVHMGDVFVTAMFPFIDVDNGGDLAGIIAFCQAVLEQIDESTVVIPGHGEVSDYQGLKNYIDIVSKLHQDITDMIERGMSLQEVIDAKPLAKYDDGTKWGASTFVNRAYTSISKKLSE